MENTNEKSGVIVMMVGGLFRYAPGGIIALATDYLDARGYMLITITASTDTNINLKYLDFIAKNADGLVLFGDVMDNATLTAHLPKDFPLVYLFSKPAGSPHTAIFLNNYSAIYSVFLSQAERGHKKFGCILESPEIVVSGEARKAYQDIILANDWKYDEQNIFYIPDDNSENIENAVSTLRKNGCTSIFSGSHRLTYLVLNHLLRTNSPNDNPVELSGIVTSTETNSLYDSINAVIEPLDQLIILAFQQVIYQMSHPGDYHEYIIKSTFEMRSLEPFYTDTLRSDSREGQQ